MDDARETPALSIGKILEERGYEVLYHDPHVKKFERDLVGLEVFKNLPAILEVTPHDLYREFEFSGVFMRSTKDFYE